MGADVYVVYLTRRGVRLQVQRVLLGLRAPGRAPRLLLDGPQRAEHHASRGVNPAQGGQPCFRRPVILGRCNALEIALVDGRPTALRFAVYACRIEAGATVEAELSEEPVEELPLPLT